LWLAGDDARRAERLAKSLKILLDDDLKSSIEWQASLIESQLGDCGAAAR
jgi:hypothetical protein